MTKGYSNPVFGVVKKFNHTEIRNLKHLTELMRDSEDEYFVFEFFGGRYETLVFDRKKLLAATEEVLDENGIRRQATPRLLKIWNAKSRE